MAKKIHVSNGAIVTDVTSTRQYVKELKKTQGLPKEVEQALATKAQAGDIAARNQLVEANLKFAIQVARQYQGMGLELEDLIAFANIGLFEAAERFDSSKNVKFVTFAVWYIRAELQKALNDLSRTVRIPSHRTATEEYSTKSIHTPVGDDENKESWADRHLEAEASRSARDINDMFVTAPVLGIDTDCKEVHKKNINPMSKTAPVSGKDTDCNVVQPSNMSNMVVTAPVLGRDMDCKEVQFRNI